MNDRWYYMKSGKEIGPVSLETLREAVRSGGLRKSDEAWREGTPDWLPLRLIREVADLFPVEDSVATTTPPEPPRVRERPPPPPERWSASPERREGQRIRAGSPQPRVFRHNSLLRWLVILPGLALGGFGLALFAYIVEEYRTDNPGKVTPIGLGVVGTILGAWTIFWGMTAISGFWLGRLVLQEDRARTPRLGLFPWSFLPLHELRLSRVLRWGSGMEDALGGSSFDGGLIGGLVVGAVEAMAFNAPQILMFEVDDEKRSDCKTVLHIALGRYPSGQAQEIYRYFEDSLGEPVELERHWFWGLRFPKQR
jgi:hypothetical protein